MKQRGNILFLILLAIILFVALTYAVMGQREGANTGIPKEKADTFAAQLIQNTSLIENNMMRAMLVDGVKEWGFDVAGTYSSRGANGTCVSGPCRIYSSRGGTVPDMEIPDWASTSTDPDDRKANFYVMQVVNLKTDLPEVAIRYSYIRKEVCDAINRRLGYTDINLTVADSMSLYGQASASNNYGGTLSAMPLGTNSGVGDTETSLQGRRSFCYMAVSGGTTYHFLHVLIER